jgi:hypothetical protein
LCLHKIESLYRHTLPDEFALLYDHGGIYVYTNPLLDRFFYRNPFPRYTRAGSPGIFLLRALVHVLCDLVKDKAVLVSHFVVGFVLCE